MAREIKEMMLAELKEELRDIGDSGCVLISYQGLKADEAIQARQAMAEQGAKMTVVKNSLFALALQDLGASALCEMISGPTAVVRANDPVAAAKAARQVAQDYAVVEVRGAYAEGQVMDAKGVEQLATIPSREALLGMIAGALLSPARRLLFAVLAKPRALLNGLQQLRDQAEEQAA